MLCYDIIDLHCCRCEKVDEKNFKDLVIYFIRYVNSKSIKILSLYSHELMGKIEEHKGKNIGWLMIIC